MEALLLINTALDIKHEVLEKLLENPGIVDAYPVYGVFDIVAITKVEDVQAFQGMLKQSIPEIMLVTALLPDAKEADFMRLEQPWLFH